MGNKTKRPKAVQQGKAKGTSGEGTAMPKVNPKPPKSTIRGFTERRRPCMSRVVPQNLPKSTIRGFSQRKRPCMSRVVACRVSFSFNLFDQFGSLPLPLFCHGRYFQSSFLKFPQPVQTYTDRTISIVPQGILLALALYSPFHPSLAFREHHPTDPALPYTLQPPGPMDLTMISAPKTPSTRRYRTPLSQAGRF